jgi:hypothetical protein
MFMIMYLYIFKEMTMFTCLDTSFVQLTITYIIIYQITFHKKITSNTQYILETLFN